MQITQLHRKKKIKMTLQNEAGIYDLLKLGFEENKKIPLATIALYLNSKNFSYQEYGYKKLKSLLEDLSFLSFENDMKSSGNAYVIIHPFKMNEDVFDVSSKQKNIDDVKKLLLKKFKKGSKYTITDVSQYLNDNKISVKNYGFAKTRKFLESMDDILTIESDKKNDSILYVNFIKNKEEKKTKSQSSSYPKPSKVPFYVPDNLLLSVKEITNLGLDNEALLKLIYNDYSIACENNRIIAKDDVYLFPLSFKSKNNEDLIASVKKAAKGLKYDFYLNFLGSDKEKAKDVLSDNVYFEDFDLAMEQLSSLAKNEKWCYHNSKDKLIILKIYLQYTFYQIIKQNKLFYDESSSYGCFNTGLKTKDYEDIYGILIKNKNKSINKKYLFQGFSVAASQGLGKIIVEHFNPLPSKPNYIKSADELVFDSNSLVHTDIKHILLDNLDRFPLSFLKKMLTPFPNEKKIILSIEKEKNPYKKETLFAKLEKQIEKNDVLFSLLKISLESSIQKAIRMVNYDYRNALPSFFPTRDVMSLMLPLIFSDDEKPSCVLLIEKTPSGNYQGQTILTLKQCYVNARLISPLDNSFLNPNEIED